MSTVRVNFLNKVSELKHNLYELLDQDYERIGDLMETNYPFDKDLAEVFSDVCDWEQSIKDKLEEEC